MAAHTAFKMRHSLEALDLELFEEGEQLVVGLIAFGGVVDRIGSGQSLLFQCEVGIEIDLGGFDRLMAEPKRDHRSIYAALQQFHGSGVAKHVG